LLEQELVEQARGGDTGAFEALARVTARRLFPVAHRIVRDSDAAEDAVQQTLVTIWKELPRLRDTQRFEAWSYRIVTRVAFEEIKRRKRRQQLAEITPDHVTAQDGTASVETRDEIERAFERLSPEHRAVVVLRFYADLPIKEIGYALGIPTGTVGSRLHRAIADLRQLIEQGDPSDPTGTSGASGTTSPDGTVLARESVR
jgi:RNA polymerase sigma-70 factor (ECF subfamily)